MTKIICLELNEVPKEIMDEIIGKINFKKHKYLLKYTPTISYDQDHLHPWVTWSSVHRGVSHSMHKISDINQECHLQDKKYPTLMNQLKQKGLKVGVFGSMHSGRVSEEDFKDYSFFVPDAFSHHAKCNPDTLNDFQRLNLSLSQTSGRAVSNKFPKKKILKNAIISYLKHPFKYRSLWCITKQLFSEIFRPWKKIRRRIVQSDILFDIYMNLLNKNKPDYSNFFSNHLASSMHRFWEAKFPSHYKIPISSEGWIAKYKNEINIAITSATYYVNSLMEFVNNNKDTQLWILSSMGQAPVQDYKKSSFFWRINDMNEFISSLMGEKIVVKKLTQMIPIYAIETNPNLIKKIINKLQTIKSNVDIKLSSHTDTTLAFTFNKKSYIEIEELPHFTETQNSVKHRIKGISKIKLDENSGSSAYHVPEGIFYRYGEELDDINDLLNDKGLFPIEKYKQLVMRTI